MKNELTGTFFLDIDGKLIELTNIEKGIEQCKAAIEFHEDCIKRHEKDSSVIMFRGLKEYWQHSLNEIEKIAMKVQKIKQEAIVCHS